MLCQIQFTGAGIFELVLISNNTSLGEGESTVLTCVGYGETDVDISWSRNDQTITNSTFVTVFESYYFQAGKRFKESLLQLCSVEMADAGMYVCEVNVGHQDVMFGVQLQVTEGELIPYRDQQ